jgi:hypothetical protein
MAIFCRSFLSIYTYFLKKYNFLLCLFFADKNVKIYYLINNYLLNNNMIDIMYYIDSCIIFI